MLGDRDDVGAGDLVDGNVLLVGDIEVDVVGADTGGDAALEVLGRLEHLSGEVGRMEGGGDDDLGILDVLAELGVGRVLVGGDDELVALLLEPVSDAELVLDGTEQTGLRVTVLAGGVKDSDDLRWASRSMNLWSAAEHLEERSVVDQRCKLTLTMLGFVVEKKRGEVVAKRGMVERRREARANMALFYIGRGEAEVQAKECEESIEQRQHSVLVRRAR